MRNVECKCSNWVSNIYKVEPIKPFNYCPWCGTFLRTEGPRGSDKNFENPWKGVSIPPPKK